MPVTSPPPPAPAPPPPSPDRLSDLHEALLLTILSLLPSHLAARTSAVSRRFRRLWTATPTVTLDRSAFRLVRRFRAAANRIFRLRDPSASILHLVIKTGDSYNRPLPLATLSSWILKAYCAGMRKLSLEIHCRVLPEIMPTVYALVALEFLSLRFFDFRGGEVEGMPLGPNPLTRLRHLEIRNVNSPELVQFIKELPSLEYLYLKDVDSKLLGLSSPTVKRLKMSSGWGGSVSLEFAFPRVEVLELEIDLKYTRLAKFKGEMPLLRKADVKLVYFEKQHVLVVADLLRSMGSVQELELYILPTNMIMSNRFHVLFEPGKEAPILPNLKNFSLSTYFHEETMENIICLLPCLPVLESLKLTHLVPIDKRMKKRRLESLMLQNARYNHSVHYRSLQIGERKQDLVKSFSARLMWCKSKRMRM